MKQLLHNFFHKHFFFKQFILLHLIGIVGLVYFWDPVWLLVTLIGTLLISSSTEILYHRKYSHRAFDCSQPIEIILNVLAVCSYYASPLHYAFIHRTHHRTSDTDQDPEKGGTTKLRNWFRYFDSPHFEQFRTRNNPDLSIIKDLTSQPIPLFFTRYGHKLYYAILILSALISVKFTFYFFVLSLIATHHNFNAINIWCHSYGYQNYDTKDKSTNNPWCFWLLGGQWHNNHHRRPACYTTASEYGERDPLGWVIKHCLATRVNEYK